MKEIIDKKRVDKINSKIVSFETESYKIIQETTIDNVELHKSMIDAFVNDGFDYEEYDIMFEQAKMRIQSFWDLKCNDIQEKEEQHLENERLAKENRLLIEANLERENKAKEEKEAVFEIRKNRLAEIGMHDKGIGFLYFTANANFNVPEYSISLGTIFNANIIDFEKIIINAKEQIEEAKLRAEQIEKQKEIDLKLSLEDAERLKKINIRQYESGQ